MNDVLVFKSTAIITHALVMELFDQEETLMLGKASIATFPVTSSILKLSLPLK